ncbi:hypothetical protein IKQ21_04060 [bacterium]|nr:hypothetical protein [bacterium]
MVSAIGNNSYGNIQRIGVSSDNRVVYRVIDSEGKDAGKMSVAQEDVDKFEKSYIDIMSTAPKIKEYVAKNSSPEDLQRRRLMSGLCVGTGGLLGAVIPSFFTKGKGVTKKVVSSVAGLVIGLAAGFATSLSVSTPPGAFKFARAARNLSKVDLKPFSDDNKLRATRM